MLFRSEMNDEDEYFDFIRNNMIYPYGLVNLVTNPIFYTYSPPKRVLAVRQILLATGKVNRRTIYYDTRNNIVEFTGLNKLNYIVNFNELKIKVYK